MRRPERAPSRRGHVLLDVRDLHVSYDGAVRALRGVSLSVPEGAVVAVLGNNGAGKSTLLRAISGTLSRRSGAITGGTDRVRRAAASSASIAAEIARSGLVQVPEGRRIFGDLTVEENLRAGGMAARDKREREAPAQRVARAVPDPGGARSPARRRCCPAASSRCSRSAGR